MAEWAAFEYREFYDYPRILIVERGDLRYLLDCPFDDAADEYPSQYSIRRFGNQAIPTGSWLGLGRDNDVLGWIAISPELFDSSRRQQIRWDLIRAAVEGAST